MLKNRDVVSLNYKLNSLERYALNFYDIDPPNVMVSEREEKEYLRRHLIHFSNE